MSIVPDLIDLFPDVVTLEHRGATDGFGEDTGYTTHSPSPRARIIDKIVNVRSENGQVIASKQYVILAGVFNTKVTDRITLPARFSVRQPQIVAVKTSTDENGEHHETVYFS